MFLLRVVFGLLFVWCVVCGGASCLMFPCINEIFVEIPNVHIVLEMCVVVCVVVVLCVFVARGRCCPNLGLNSGQLMHCTLAFVLYDGVLQQVVLRGALCTCIYIYIYIYM